MTAPTPPVEPLTEPQEPAEEPKPAGQDLSPEALQAELRRARDDAAKYRKQYQEVKPLADKAREAEEAQKSELQKATDRLSELERERNDARTESLRFRVAASHAIKADDIDLLGSGTEEEMTAKAQRIAALYTAQTPTPTPSVPGRPVEQLRPGATPSDHESPDEATWRALGFPPVTTP